MDKTERSECGFSCFLYRGAPDSIETTISNVSSLLLLIVAASSVALGSLYLTNVISASVMLPCTLAPTLLLPYLLYRGGGQIDMPKWISILPSCVLISCVYNQVLSPNMAVPLFFFTSLPILLTPLVYYANGYYTHRIAPPKQGLLVDGVKTVAFAAFASLLLFTNALSSSIAAPTFLVLATLSLIASYKVNENQSSYLFLVWLVNAAACTLVFFNQLPPEFLTGMALCGASLYLGFCVRHILACLKLPSGGDRDGQPNFV